MLGCAIVENDLETIHLLKNYIQQTSGLYIAAISNDLSQAFRSGAHISFISSDIYQNSELITTLAACTILLTEFSVPYSGLPTLCKHALKYSAFIYTVQRVAGYLDPHSFSLPHNEFFFIPTNNLGKMRKIYCKDIYYIEACSNYTRIHHINGMILIYSSMTAILNKLPNGSFLRVHKSYIVNVLHIIEFDGNRVFLGNSGEIAIGKTYRSDFYRFINRFTLKTILYLIPLIGIISDFAE